MRASDNVRIRRQFRSYEKSLDEICIGDKVYCAVLPPQGNSRKLQLQWSGPAIVTKIINKAMLEVKQYEVKNPWTYVAHQSKIRLAKKMGQKDVDPLFKLPRLPAEVMKDLAEELSTFELPAKQLDAKVIDEFHSQASEIHHRGRDHRSSISSEPPVIPQNLSGSSIAASSEESENVLFQSFIQSLGSARSNGSSPEELLENHFQVEDELLDEMLQDSPAEDDGVTGSAANLIPEPEPEKTPEPRRSQNEDNDEPEEGDVEPTEINTPTRRQEEQQTRKGEEIPERINTPRTKLLKQQISLLMIKNQGR